jgi:hypothetical protein
MKRKDRIVQFRVSEDLAEDLKMDAGALGLNLSEYMRYLLRNRNVVRIDRATALQMDRVVRHMSKGKAGLVELVDLAHNMVELERLDEKRYALMNEEELREELAQIHEEMRSL